MYGEKGGLHWSHEQPNILKILWPHRPHEILHMGAGNSYLHHETLANLRTPAGHPEGYLEAFANIYKNFAATLQAKLDGRTPSKEALDFPGVEDGIRGMAFIDNVVASANSELKWTEHKI